MNTPNARVTLDQLVFKTLYYRYKIFITPLATIFVCLLIFWFVVMGQIQNFLSIRDAISLNEQDLQILHQNLTTISKLDDAQLNTTLTVATSALPAEKDFAGIISSLQTAAGVAGISLQDYSFQVGNLSGLDQNGKATQLPVQLNVILKGNVQQAQVFMKQLSSQLPLSDTTALSLNSNDSITVTAIFYYASLPKIVFKDTAPLPILGKDDAQLLQSLSVNSSLSSVIVASPAATNSPTIIPTPTAGSTPTPVGTTSAK